MKSGWHAPCEHYYWYDSNIHAKVGKLFPSNLDLYDRANPRGKKVVNLISHLRTIWNRDQVHQMESDSKTKRIVCDFWSQSNICQRTCTASLKKPTKVKSGQKIRASLFRCSTISNNTFCVRRIGSVFQRSMADSNNFFGTQRLLDSLLPSF